MNRRSPLYIQRFLDANLHRFDLGVQYLGDEPNAERKPWDTATVRWCLVASWPYEQAAGNSSIPAVYKAINRGRADFLADRFYLPATPRDLRILDRGHVPTFGIETKHPLADFDVVASSIAYPVLTMSFTKLLTAAGIPLRWRDRDTQHPMVMVGGLSYGAPEMLAPVVDCWWLGEVEDEPGNPGMSAVCARISSFKADGAWLDDRLGCYRALAREFNFLYFPRFVDVVYRHEDRSHVGVGPHPSKQVAGYTSNLPGMRMPFTRRIVKNLDNIRPLDDPPLLYVDPAMGSGDLEVGRGCPAWCVSHNEYVFQAGVGIVRVGDLVAQGHIHPADRGLRVQLTSMARFESVSCAIDMGVKPLVRVRTEQGHYVDLTADHRVRIHTRRSGKLSRGQLDWKSAGDLVPGDVVPVHYGQGAFGGYQTLPRSGRVLTADLAWLVGFLVGDGAVHVDRRGEVCALGFGVWAGSAVEAHVRKLCAQELDAPRLAEHPVGDGKINWMRWQRKALVGPLVDDLGFGGGRGTEDSKLHVPTAVLRSPESVQRAFVMGLFEADGNIDAEGKFLRLVSVSQRLVREVSLMLLNLGCAATWHKKLVPVNRGLVRGGRGYAFHLNVRPALDSDLSWWSFVAPGKQVRAMAVTAPRVVDAGASNRNYLMSRRSPIMARVSEVENLGPGPVADFTMPGIESFDCSGLNVHNCSFCALTYRAKPYRQRSVESTVAYAKAMQDNMGAVRMAPFSPDFPMHTQRKKLIAELLTRVNDEVDAPTMRVDDFIADNQFILLQVHGGMDSVTLGVEGNSQRMRDLIGKGTSDAEIHEAVTRGIRAGIRKFKLYMISALPGEDEGDIYRILKLAKDLADIRDQNNQPNVRIQFSWTPLMIEANTPMQWFAPTPQSRLLGDVWEEFRDLKIDFKLGAKAEPNKAAFFQLCQRASRDVGEAIIDALEAVDQACWGGVPRTFKDLLQQRLYAHDFRNGFGDCFDERFLSDMFGWEFIDQGISTELMWTTYVQMREFVENTDSHTYEQNFDSGYHGNEWVERCDTRCQGKTCGACDHTDLRIRTQYIRAAQGETAVDLSAIQPVDQRTQAIRVRARLHHNPAYRQVGNAHWRFAVRRAAYRAHSSLNSPFAVAKRSIRFASDEIKQGNWVSGVDYVEFALTRTAPAPAVAAFIQAMNTHLDPWLRVGDFVLQPTGATTLRADIATAFYDIQCDTTVETALTQLDSWQAAEQIPMRLRVDGGYFAPANEWVNAKSFVEDLWLTRDGHRLSLRMLIHGRPSPYHVYAALMGSQSWTSAAHLPAQRLEAFIDLDRAQQDFLRPNCAGCALVVPINLLDQPHHHSHCPRCLDSLTGALITWKGPPVTTPTPTPVGPDPSNTALEGLLAPLEADDTAVADLLDVPGEAEGDEDSGDGAS